MKLIIAYIPYVSPGFTDSVKEKIGAVSFSELSGYGKQDILPHQGIRIEKYCEDEEVDHFISCIKECIGYKPPACLLSEEEKQDLISQGFTEEDLKPVDPVRPNGENLGKLIVLSGDSLGGFK